MNALNARRMSSTVTEQGTETKKNERYKEKKNNDMMVRAQLEYNNLVSMNTMQRQAG